MEKILALHEEVVAAMRAASDEHLSTQAMFQAIPALQAAGLPVQWIRRPGLGHAIDPVGIEAGGRFLAAMLAGEGAKP